MLKYQHCSQNKMKRRNGNLDKLFSTDSLLRGRKIKTQPRKKLMTGGKKPLQLLTGSKITDHLGPDYN